MSTEIGMRCSEACTRSGLAALILAAVAFGLLPVTDEAIRTNSLRQYLNLRLALAETMSQIKNEDCWKSLSLNRPLQSLSMEEAERLECIESIGQSGVDFKVQPKSSQLEMPRVQTQSSSSTPPPIPQAGKKQFPRDTTHTRQLTAPTLLSMSRKYEMPYLAILKEILSNLGNVELLEKAREVSPRYDHAILRWEQQRYMNALRRLQSNGENGLSGLVDTNKDSSNAKDFSWSTMTIGDITEITLYELPTYEISDEIESRRQRINIPSVPIPMDLRVGASVLLAGLLMVATFFWLYYQEGKRNKAHLTQGTIFSVLHQHTIGRILFIALTLVPMTSAALLAFKFFSSSYLPNSILQISLVVLLSTISLSVLWNSNIAKTNVPNKNEPGLRVTLDKRDVVKINKISESGN
jgi:hypothetical protein